MQLDRSSRMVEGENDSFDATIVTCDSFHEQAYTSAKPDSNLCTIVALYVACLS